MARPPKPDVPYHAHARLIEQVGTAALARAGGWSKARVSQWKRHGIPKVLRISVGELFEQRFGLDLPKSFYNGLPVLILREGERVA